MARAALTQYSEKWNILHSGELGYRKLRGAVRPALLYHLLLLLLLVLLLLSLS